MANPENPQENIFESNESETAHSLEKVESSEDVKNEIAQEVENTSSEFESSDSEISHIEAEVDLITPEEVSEVKNELNFDSKIKALNDQAKILQLETEQQLDWVALGEDHQFDENNFYRVVNEKGYADYLENGVVRSSPTGDKPKQYGNMQIAGRPTAFPSFAKGAPDLDMYSEKDMNNYVLESDQEMYRRGDVNPVTQNTIRGRHYAYRPIDQKTGDTITELDSSAIKDVYKKDKLGELYRQIKNEKESS